MWEHIKKQLGLSDSSVNLLPCLGSNLQNPAALERGREKECSFYEREEMDGGNLTATEVVDRMNWVDNLNI